MDMVAKTLHLLNGRKTTGIVPNKRPAGIDPSTFVAASHPCVSPNNCNHCTCTRRTRMVTKE